MLVLRKRGTKVTAVRVLREDDAYWLIVSHRRDGYWHRLVARPLHWFEASRSEFDELAHSVRSVALCNTRAGTSLYLVLARRGGHVTSGEVLCEEAGGRFRFNKPGWPCPLVHAVRVALATAFSDVKNSAL